MKYMKVYLLQHSYVLNEADETKIIGIYSSREKAEMIVEYYKVKPGFSEHKDDFFIDEYIVDENNWEDGFVTIR
jgi:hypothetical protein